MGLDGGTICTRTDLLRGASWRLANHDGGAHRSTRGGQLSDPRAALSSVAGRETPASRQQSAVDAFDTCALSGVRLPARPAEGAVVACALGRLYLRDRVVEFLARSGQFAAEAGDVGTLAAAFSHLQRLRDVFPVVLEPNPERARSSMSASEAGGGSQFVPGPWLCPVDRAVETNGQHPFVALRPCGHVMREQVARECARAVKEAPHGRVGASDGVSTIEGARWGCPVCSMPVEVTVRLFPPAAEAEAVRKSLKKQRDEKAARQQKKQKRKLEDGDDGVEEGP
ncbi:hypothetical protein AB1Y20_019849 [Prymnesium parvum]|uniref:Replication termination factor 2 n=1 Tax=Prymnesium parvum TaxID=97485 RepID=A0AB34JS42_PRYPA